MRVLGNRNLSVIPVNSKGRNQCSVVDSVEAGRGGDITRGKRLCSDSLPSLSNNLCISNHAIPSSIWNLFARVCFSKKY